METEKEGKEGRRKTGEWMDGWKARWIDGWGMGEWMDRWMGSGVVYGWKGQWVGGWVDEWRDEQQILESCDCMFLNSSSNENWPCVDFPPA